MTVSLLRYDDLSMTDMALGECWDKGPYNDEWKQRQRIDRVCNKMKHESLLEFTNYVFEIEASTSVLLEMTRHRIGTSYAVRSSRYTLKAIAASRRIDFELSRNQKVMELLLKHIIEIETLIRENPDIANDDLKLLLPQAYTYKWLVQMNARSLKHFFLLRRSKATHYHIRNVAEAMCDLVPEEHKFLYKEG